MCRLLLSGWLRRRNGGWVDLPEEHPEKRLRSGLASSFEGISMQVHFLQTSIRPLDGRLSSSEDQEMIATHRHP